MTMIVLVVWRIPAEQFSPSNDPGYCLRVDWMDGKPEHFKDFAKVLHMLRILAEFQGFRQSPTYLWMSPYIPSSLSLFFIYMHPFTHFHLHFNFKGQTDIRGMLAGFPRFWPNSVFFVKSLDPLPSPPVPKLLKGGHWRLCQKYEYICNTQQIIKGNSYFSRKSSLLVETNTFFFLTLLKSRLSAAKLFSLV